MNDKIASIQKHVQESSPTTVADRMFHDMMNVVTAVRSGFSKVFEDENHGEGQDIVNNAYACERNQEKPRMKRTDVINDALRDIGSEVVALLQLLQLLITAPALLRLSLRSSMIELLLSLFYSYF